MMIGCVLGCCVLAGASCSNGSGSLSSDRRPGDPIRVVASTDVYGNIAALLGGSKVEVVSIITDPNRDPHEYEATARDQLAVDRANVVIANGGGYDDFMTRLIAIDVSKDVVDLDATAIARHHAPSGTETNEHVWYDVSAMARLADRLETAYAAQDPGSRSYFSQRAVAFRRQLVAIATAEKELFKTYAGRGVLETEPVAGYLLRSIGLVDRTPDGFSEAVEAGEPISARVRTATLRVLERRGVSLLAINPQTGGPSIDAAVNAARKAHIPVVAFTETLPEGKDYLSWMRANVAQVEAALATHGERS